MTTFHIFSQLNFLRHAAQSLSFSPQNFILSWMRPNLDFERTFPIYELTRKTCESLTAVVMKKHHLSLLCRVSIRHLHCSTCHMWRIAAWLTHFLTSYFVFRNMTIYGKVCKLNCWQRTFLYKTPPFDSYGRTLFGESFETLFVSHSTPYRRSKYLRRRWQIYEYTVLLLKIVKITKETQRMDFGILLLQGKL